MIVEAVLDAANNRYVQISRHRPFCIQAYNKQVDRFVSWYPHPDAEVVDAFMLNVRVFDQIYAFPHFSLVGQRLQKLQEEILSRRILIAPWWPIQTWFTLTF